MTKSKTPTEPGWYWCRCRKGRLEVREVVLRGLPHRNMLSARDTKGEFYNVECSIFQWGDRIPEPHEPLPLPKRFLFRFIDGVHGNGVVSASGRVDVFYGDAGKFHSWFMNLDDIERCGHKITEWIDE